MKHIHKNPLVITIQKATGAFLDGGRPLHSAVIQQAVEKQQEPAPISKPAEDGSNGDISEQFHSSHKSPFSEVRSSQEKGYKFPSRSSKVRRDGPTWLALLRTQLDNLKSLMASVSSAQNHRQGEAGKLLAGIQELKAGVNNAKRSWKDVSLVPELMILRTEVWDLEEAIDSLTFSGGYPELPGPIKTSVAPRDNRDTVSPEQLMEGGESTQNLQEDDLPPQEKVVSWLLGKPYHFIGRVMDQSVHGSSWEEPHQLSADFRSQEYSAVREVSGESCDIGVQKKVTNPADGISSTSKPQNKDVLSKGQQKSFPNLDLAQLKEQSHLLDSDSAKPRKTSPEYSGMDQRCRQEHSCPIGGRGGLVSCEKFCNFEVPPFQEYAVQFESKSLQEILPWNFDGKEGQEPSTKKRTYKWSVARKSPLAGFQAARKQGCPPWASKVTKSGKSFSSKKKNVKARIRLWQAVFQCLGVQKSFKPGTAPIGTVKKRPAQVCLRLRSWSAFQRLGFRKKDPHLRKPTV